MQMSRRTRGHSPGLFDIMHIIVDGICFIRSLKIPKGQPETVYRRRTDNTMVKRKSTKGQTTVYKTCIYKQEDYT